MHQAKLLDGRQAAAAVHERTRARVRKLRARGIEPAVVFFRVGDDPASELYVRRKEKQARELGIRSETVVLPAPSTERELLDRIEEKNRDPGIHGILVQMPLPQQIRAEAVCQAIHPAKDIDGFHPVNAGKLLLGDPSGFAPCTPAGICELFRHYGLVTSGAEVVILGRSNIVGKPLAALLLARGSQGDATVTVLHSQSRHIAEHCRRADFLIAAIGKAEFVRGSMIKPGAVVVDVGVTRLPLPSVPGKSRIVGDVHFSEAVRIAAWLTPNPGGVGPMTIAMLLANTVEAAERLAG
ncbi:Methylenetetrahydrofolate dehydrogenase / Methenyltetrahydrofolate cyclohydrolase [Methylacidimicrobium sp. AP8]|uniref:bifunctional 5,10-methylenetetrahydrofolate dehydrogenase/5,10-methenyltetrahydrofolate cyclohydrolase n=1 Tax=Methylacidimicrobium sp. AP8 TaxID=2730359 RepID=UPI0018C1B710|nr:bifunctional 5,10-methylenetetrahydrofolate dehydrogenase/5,10-methenyltetrahydrofolate cyclohydrolase [Methylacidimicrobium sp. AP8]CAB4243059.1 Methylenetetrahydrofolate dehydrogenase / Methenyltetrahydrofolate cyclohydrolase [Methylacidimicrobium sp. AP8]